MIRAAEILPTRPDLHLTQEQAKLLQSINAACAEWSAMPSKAVGLHQHILDRINIDILDGRLVIERTPASFAFVARIQ